MNAAKVKGVTYTLDLDAGTVRRMSKTEQAIVGSLAMLGPVEKATLNTMLIAMTSRKRPKASAAPQAAPA